MKWANWFIYERKWVGLSELKVCSLVLLLWWPHSLARGCICARCIQLRGKLLAHNQFLGLYSIKRKVLCMHLWIRDLILFLLCKYMYFSYCLWLCLNLVMEFWLPWILVIPCMYVSMHFITFHHVHIWLIRSLYGRPYFCYYGGMVI